MLVKTKNTISFQQFHVPTWYFLFLQAWFKRDNGSRNV